jgi:hypothetical protein
LREKECLIWTTRSDSYCQDQMYFECNVCILAEDWPRMAARDYNMTKLVEGQRSPFERHGLGGISGAISLIEGHPPISGNSIGRWAGGWLGVIEDYTTRQLTKGEDKLPALSGLAIRLANITGYTYYAGLWRAHILEGLYWHIYARTESRIQVPGGPRKYMESRITLHRSLAHTAPS